MTEKQKSNNLITNTSNFLYMQMITDPGFCSDYLNSKVGDAKW